MLGGQVQVMFDALSSSIEHVKAGRLRPLAVTTATRLEVLPNVPTVGEFVPGYEAVLWQGIGAPGPSKILAEGTDWRFFNELKRELKS